MNVQITAPTTLDSPAVVAEVRSGQLISDTAARTIAGWLRADERPALTALWAGESVAAGDVLSDIAAHVEDDDLGLDDADVAVINALAEWVNAQ